MGTNTVMLVVRVAPVAFKVSTLENNGSVKVPLFAAFAASVSFWRVVTKVPLSKATFVVF